jgi:hypothetical protein
LDGRLIPSLDLIGETHTHSLLVPAHDTPQAARILPS